MNPHNLHIYVMTHSLMAEIEGAKAANAQRESEGKAQAYDDSFFAMIVHQLNNLAQSIDHTARG